MGDYVDWYFLFIVFLVRRDEAVETVPLTATEALYCAHTVGGDEAVNIAERQEGEVLNALEGYYVAIDSLPELKL